VPEPQIRVPFGDLRRFYCAHHDVLDDAVARVLRSGRFILGPELEAFEEEFAAYCGAPFCVGCGSGTEAIHLALAAHGIAAGDRVVTVANTCVPTVAGIGCVSSNIALCDADERTALMDPHALADTLRRTPAKAVIVVHLYGQPADLDTLQAAADRCGALLIEDAAQAHGARYKGTRVGGHGPTACWSFYPSKNLGAFGDAGAVTTHSAEIAARARKLRNYGQERRYYHSMRGTNSRLDEVQAAVLRARLPMLDAGNERRREIARRYRAGIHNPAVGLVQQLADTESCEHLFPIRCARRDVLQAELAARGVECLIHYPVPIHLQEAYAGLGYARGAFPRAERLCDEVLSLPMFPELTDDEVAWVIRCVNEALRG
jgi:dTDP-3-amino-3,4,6-trideoxy-alpha-D-glucose transaminase